jgi:hypothetical protein
MAHPAERSACIRCRHARNTGRHGVGDSDGGSGRQSLDVLTIGGTLPHEQGPPRHEMRGAQDRGANPDPSEINQTIPDGLKKKNGAGGPVGSRIGPWSPGSPHGSGRRADRRSGRGASADHERSIAPIHLRPKCP